MPMQNVLRDDRLNISHRLSETNSGTYVLDRSFKQRRDVDVRINELDLLVERSNLPTYCRPLNLLPFLSLVPGDNALKYLQHTKHNLVLILLFRVQTFSTDIALQSSHEKMLVHICIYTCTYNKIIG